MQPAVAIELCGCVRILEIPLCKDAADAHFPLLAFRNRVAGVVENAPLDVLLRNADRRRFERLFHKIGAQRTERFTHAVIVPKLIAVLAVLPGQSFAAGKHESERGRTVVEIPKYGGTDKRYRDAVPLDIILQKAYVAVRFMADQMHRAAAHQHLEDRHGRDKIERRPHRPYRGRSV